jgi:hypothetical protein
MDPVMKYDEFLNEANSPKPSDAELEQAAQQAAQAIAKIGLESSIGRTYFRGFVQSQGTWVIDTEFKGPMKPLLDKGITPRKIARRAKELAIEIFNSQVERGSGRDS